MTGTPSAFDILRAAFIACAGIATAPALANDGFYQGSGSTLQMVNNPHLRVREEKLVIYPNDPVACYPVYADGKPVQDGMQHQERPVVTLGPRAKCEDSFRQLYAKWHAVAEYDVEVLQAQDNVQIGFPVAWWNRDYVAADGDLASLEAPGVAAFHTYINGAEIRSLALKTLQSPGASGLRRAAVGYAWKASFAAGQPYRLKTEYDFGADVSNAFYAGSEYAEGETPWFFQVVDAGTFTASRLIYFLTPINSWAPPPPDRISIEVRLPAGIPVTYFVPVYFKPSCVSSGAMHFRIEHRGPARELELSMANRENTRGALRPLTTVAQWNAWQKTLGGPSVKIGCDVIEALMKTAAPDLRARLQAYQCAASCGAQ